jgi:aryl-phospho-beta-D-glucosidase BglC (GH1 family)
MKIIKKIICLSIIICVWNGSKAQPNAWQRANSMGKGVNFSLWLESPYPYFCAPASYPNNSLFTRQTVQQAKAMCFQTIRVPVMFEAFDIIGPTPVDPRVIRALPMLDSVIAWTKEANMNVVIDNHIADDITDMCGNNLQNLYGITDANYASRAQVTAAKWKAIAARFAYTDPNHVFFELRNEPNGVSDANVHKFFQTVIDTVRKYDNKHTLIVGNSGYYDVGYLAASTPYSDNNLIYTFHTYTPFTEVNQGGEGIVNIATAPFTAYPTVAQKTAIKNEFLAAQGWSQAHNLPVILGEFGSRTMAEAKGDHTSRCEWIKTYGEMLDSTHFPWTYWDYNTYSEDYGDGSGVHYRYGIFDNPTNNPALNDAAHIYSCFKNALHIGGTCSNPSGIENTTSSFAFNLYPNPSSSEITIGCPEATKGGAITITNMLGSIVFEKTITHEKETIPVFDFAKGLYVLKVEVGGQTQTKKMVVE